MYFYVLQCQPGVYNGDNVMKFGMSLQYGDFYLHDVSTWSHSLPAYVHNSASEVKKNLAFRIFTDIHISTANLD